MQAQKGDRFGVGYFLDDDDSKATPRTAQGAIDAVARELSLKILGEVKASGGETDIHHLIDATGFDHETVTALVRFLADQKLVQLMPDKYGNVGVKAV